MTDNATTHVLSLRDIAAWQIDSIQTKEKAIVADLPALQRGAVWKVQQIEELWDSMLRGFPIGSFILSPPNAALLRQDFKLQRPHTDPSPRTPTHLLLDGQQRATAIALAFDDLWRLQDDAAKAALWVDLDVPPPGRQVAYVFRVLTRAHPWGYLRSNPQEILSASAIRAALRAWQTAHQFPDKRPDEYPLWATWPWDCTAPVPMAVLIAALHDHPNNLDAVRKALWQKLQKLPLLNPDGASFLDDDTQTTEARRHTLKQQNTLRAAFTNATAPSYQRLNHLLQRLEDLLHGPTAYRVPALVLHLTSLDQDAQDAQDAPSERKSNEQTKDAIELLFVRINSAGTPLAGEELAYSLLKAEWPEVANWMQKLSNKPAQPSRIAALCIRLVLARTTGHPESSRQITLPAMPAMPGMPGMAGMQELRRLLHNDTFHAELKKFIFTDATGLFNSAWAFLTQQGFALLPTQAVDMAQHAPDVYLLLLRWIDRLATLGLTPKSLTLAQHRRTLGFLSAVAWFAPDKNRACAAIWPHLEANVDADKLKDRFNVTRFRVACHLSERSALRMIPLPSPDELADVCQRFMENDGRTTQTKKQMTMHFPEGSFWTEGNWWYSHFVPALGHSLSETWKAQVSAKAQTEQEDREAPDYADLVQQIASHFLDTLWAAKPSVLLYAQRGAIKTWFPRFDPSLPEMMEDRNRPWDWDHLLPNSYFSGRRNIPQSVKDWGNSIGNLRAWPLEANRSDGDAIAKIKLSDTASNKEEKRYGIATGVKKREASFVNNDLDWDHWKKATPADDTDQVPNKNYLSNSADSSAHPYRIDAVTAMMKRFNALYCHWYEELRLKDLA